MSNATATTGNGGNSFIAQSVLYLGLFLFAYTVPLASPAKEAIAQTLELAQPEDTWPLFTTYIVGGLHVIPPCAFLADRFGRKAMLLIGSLTLAAGMLMLSFAPNLAWACVAQFLNGAGAIILQIIGIAVVTDMYADKRGSVLSLAVGLVGMVALFSPMLMGELLQQGVSWTLVYRYSAMLPVLAFLAQLFCAFPAAGERVPIRGSAIRELLGMPLFVLLVASMLVYGIVEQGIPIWASSYLGQELGVSPRWQGIVVSGYFLIMSLARALIGGFRLFEKVPYPTMIATSAILGAVSLAIGTLAGIPVLAGIFLALAGAAIAMIWPSIMTYAVEATGKPTATVFGLVVGIGGSTGAILGASTLGLIKQAGLSYQQSLLTLEFPLLLLLIVFGGIAWSKRAVAVKSVALPD
jgi:MFS family permease